MREDLVERIARNPEYVALKSRRARFGWWLTILMLVVYYGFILFVACTAAVAAGGDLGQAAKQATNSLRCRDATARAATPPRASVRLGARQRASVRVEQRRG